MITDKILLDIETPRLGKIVIQSGGSLVWSPHHKVSLKARAIKLGSEGSLDIGSADCPYEEDTSITLLGMFICDFHKLFSTTFHFNRD